MGDRTDTQRLQELMLFIAHRMAEDRHAGAGRIKMAKLIWRIDFEAFWKLGKPITETTYVADKFGPSPVAELLAAKDLEAAGRFEWVQDWDRRVTPVPRDDARMRIFAEDERRIIDDVIDRFRNTSGGQMVDEAHAFPGWIHAWRDGDGKDTPIPFESIFWDRRTELSDESERHAATLSQTFSDPLR